MHLSQDDCRALFKYYDSDADGCFSQQEFLSFAKDYPLLMEILFLRCRDFWKLRKLVEEQQSLLREHAALQERIVASQRDGDAAAKAIEVKERHRCLAIDDRDRHAAQMAQCEEVVKRCEAQLQSCGDVLATKAGDVQAGESVQQFRVEETSAWCERCDQWEWEVARLAEEEAEANDAVTRLREQLRAAEDAAAAKTRLLQEAQQHSASCRASHVDAVGVLHDAEQHLMALKEGYEEAQRDQLRVQEEMDEQLVRWKRFNELLQSDDDHIAALDNVILQAEQAKEAIQSTEKSCRIEAEHACVKASDLEKTIEVFKVHRASIDEQESAVIEQEMKLQKERQELQSRHDNLHGTISLLHHDAYVSQ